MNSHSFLLSSPKSSQSRTETPQSSTSTDSSQTTDTKIRRDVLRLYNRAVSSSCEKDAEASTRTVCPEGDSRAAAQVIDMSSVDDEKAEFEFVDWDSDEDPSNPLNWSRSKKTINIMVIFMMCVVSPFASSVFAPATLDLQLEFHSVDSYLSAFVVSVFLLGYAAGPLLISPLSEIYGRVPLYHMCNLVFVGGNCWCASTHSFQTLAVARFVAGVGGSSVYALALSSVADMVREEKRGGVLALIGFAYNLGPAVSPMAGSHINSRWGWRWIFWVTAIMGAFCTLAALPLLSETYEPVLLHRKAARLQREQHSRHLRSKLDVGTDKTPARRFWTAMTMPLRMLLFCPPILVTSVLAAVGYGFMYILYTTLPRTLLYRYDWAPENVGYAYLGIATGNLVAMVAGGGMTNAIARRRAAQGDARPENRLVPLIVLWPFAGIGLLVYAWGSEKEVNYFVPLVGSAIFGVGSMSAIFFCGIYIIDAYTTHSASGTAASLVLRSVLGGVVPLFSNKLYARFDVGWAFSILGFVALALCPVPYLFYRYGERMRKGWRWRWRVDGEQDA